MVVSIIGILVGLVLPAVQAAASRPAGWPARTISSRSGWHSTPTRRCTGSILPSTCPRRFNRDTVPLTPRITTARSLACSASWNSHRCTTQRTSMGSRPNPGLAPTRRSCSPRCPSFCAPPICNRPSRVTVGSIVDSTRVRLLAGRHTGDDAPGSWDGPFTAFRTYGPADFGDGLSQTVGGSERTQGRWIFDAATSGDYRLTTTWNGMFIPPGAADWALGVCAAAAPGLPTVQPPRAKAEEFSSGFHFTESTAADSAEPAGPGLLARPLGRNPARGPPSSRASSPRSRHPGGVNMLMMDRRAVRFHEGFDRGGCLAGAGDSFEMAKPSRNDAVRSCQFKRGRAFGSFWTCAPCAILKSDDRRGGERSGHVVPVPPSGRLGGGTARPRDGTGARVLADGGRHRLGRARCS